MKQRIITGAILIAVLVPAVYFGGIYFTIVGTVLSIISCYECLKLFKVKYPLYAVISLYVLFTLTPLLTTIVDDSLFSLMLLVMMALLVIFLVWSDKFDLEKIGVIFFIFAFMQILISTIHLIHQKEIQLLMMLIIGTYITDAFCLFGGKLLGKHKLNVRISPNKTIEGALSGWLIGFIAALVYSLFRVHSISTLNLVILAILVPVFAQLGDLTFSAIKRRFGVKDFGNIFPGHGGVLDRIDSLSLVMVLYLIISYLF